MADSAGQTLPRIGGDVIFHSGYGEFPRFLWYFLMPVFLAAAVLLYVNAHWFGQGLWFKGVKFSPATVKAVICPLMGTLCILINATAIYRRLRPQEILVTTEGVQLPRGRWTQETFVIPWEHLRAESIHTEFMFLDVYELTCIDDRDDSRCQISSMLFRSFNDFATLHHLLAHHMGQNWPIHRFLPSRKKSR